MCKHVLNAQVYFQSPCCGKWYECTECHDEHEDHGMSTATTMMFTCKVCSRVFEQDLKMLTPLDNRCTHCGNCYILPAVTQESLMFEEAQEYINHALEKLLDPAHRFFSSIPGHSELQSTKKVPR